MPDFGQGLQQLFGDYAAFIDTRYSFGAACIVLWYDFSLTFAREIKCFWSPFKWGRVEALFLVNRYIPLIISTVNVAGGLIPHISSTLCWFWIAYWSAIGPMLQTILINLVICYRLYLIFHRNNQLLIFMLGFMVLVAGAASGILGVLIKNGHSVVSPFPSITYCYIDSGGSDRIFWMIYLPSLFFESFTFSCALWQTYRQIREFKGLKGRSAENGEDGSSGKTLGHQLIEAMFRDSLLYFFCMLMFLLANCLVLRFEVANQSGFAEISLGPSLSVTSIICTHILLHSRESIEEIYHPEVNMSTLPSMQFARRDELTVLAS